MRNQANPQGRQTLASLPRPPETAFGLFTLDPREPDGEPVLTGSQKSRWGLLLKDTERF